VRDLRRREDGAGAPDRISPTSRRADVNDPIDEPDGSRAPEDPGVLRTMPCRHPRRESNRVNGIATTDPGDGNRHAGFGRGTSERTTPLSPRRCQPRSRRTRASRKGPPPNKHRLEAHRPNSVPECVLHDNSLSSARRPLVLRRRPGKSCRFILPSFADKCYRSPGHEDP
jgi:hypothetical protein